jgi:hypothetical protein
MPSSLRKDMIEDWFGAHLGLAASARFPPLAPSARRISAVELSMLLGCGAAAAAAVGLAKLGLRIPGHAIVLAALPMALGLSLAPRRLAGSVMSAGAAGTALLLGAVGGATYGSGSVVSLFLLGPMMDVALRGARTGRLIYAALVLSGVGANLLALGSRAAAKLLGLDLAGARPFDSWWLQAAATYTLSGVIAGLLGALCWFHLRDRSAREMPES